MSYGSEGGLKQQLLSRFNIYISHVAENPIISTSIGEKKEISILNLLDRTHSFDIETKPVILYSLFEFPWVDHDGAGFYIHLSSCGWMISFPVLQSYCRRYLAQLHYKKLKKAAITTQSAWRGRVARKELRKLKMVRSPCFFLVSSFYWPIFHIISKRKRHCWVFSHHLVL